MKQMFKYTLWIMFVLLFNIGCTLASRETFDLEYQESKLLETLKNGPFRSLEESGIYNHATHDVWDFDITKMEVTTYSVEAEEDILPKTTYTFNVIKDESTQAGVIRLFGSGPFNDKYVGVSALTNAHGAFLKLNVQDSLTDASLNASNKPFWEFVTEPTIFRANIIYPDQHIIKLDRNGFWNVENYSYFIPKTTSSGSTKTYSFDHYDAEVDDVSGNTTHTFVKTVNLVSTLLIPANTEIYVGTIGGAGVYVGMEFFSDTNVSTSMKYVEGSSYDDVKAKLANTSAFGWNIAANAKIDNTVIKSLAPFQMVKLVNLIPINTDGADYFWDKTDELIFDADKMTLNIITTKSVNSPYQDTGITNFLSYNLKMIKRQNDNVGLFTMEGLGKYNNHWGLLRTIRKNVEGTEFMYADFKPLSRDIFTSNDAVSELEDMADNDAEYVYQDKKTARLPYRLVEELGAVGTATWVTFRENALGSVSYDPKDTEHYDFLDANPETRKLKYIAFSGEIIDTSFYKVKIVVDNNKTNGIFQLKGYSEDFETPDPTASMHNRYVAIELGTDIHHNQAKYAIGFTLEEARSALSRVQTLNLYEKSALPSDHKVISAMERFNPWVAMIYPDPSGVAGAAFAPGVVPTPRPDDDVIPSYKFDHTYKLIFDTDGDIAVSIIEIMPGASEPYPTTKYSLKTTAQSSDIYATFCLEEKLNNGPGNLVGQHISVRTGVGEHGNKGFIHIDPIEQTTKDEVTRMATSYNYHAEASAPKDSKVVENISGITFMQSELEDGVPNGKYVPWNTKYYTFTYGTSILDITSTNGSGGSSTEQYTFLVTSDRGLDTGIVQLQGQNLPLNNQYLRIDVQNGTDAKKNIRLILNGNPTDLENISAGGTVTPIGNQAAFTTLETTHQDKNEVIMTHNALDMVDGNKWASVDPTDKMDDYKNGQEISFGVNVDGNPTITVDNNINGQLLGAVTHTYDIMEDKKTSDSEYEAVIRLTGSGSLLNNYMALKAKAPTAPVGNGPVATEGVAFAFGNSYNEAKRNLRDAYIPYIDPYANANNLAAFTSFVSDATTAGGYGTPSFVWMKQGTYSRDDTETWAFNTDGKTVKITHKNDNNNIEATYTVYMIEADSLTGPGTRANALFYLRSATDPSLSDAPYNRKFVSIRNHRMNGTPGSTPLSAVSDFKAVINADKNVAVDSTTLETDMQQMQDIRSATIAARAFDLAAGRLWVRLDEAAYQLDATTTYEEWTFKPENRLQVIVKTINSGTGTTAREDTYNFASRSDISSHRGTFLLTDTVTPSTGRYHNHVVAIGIGNELATTIAPIPSIPAYGYGGHEFDGESMRLAAVPVGIDADVARSAAIIAMENYSEWNFRVKGSAQRSFESIMTAKSYDDKGWSELKGPNYTYDPDDTARWNFEKTTNTAGADFNNNTGSTVHDILISADAGVPAEAGRHGIKLLSSTRTTASFQIFRKNSVNSNQFVVLELGTGDKEKFMRVGMDVDLSAAQSKFEDLARDNVYNWYTHGKAIANDTLIDAAASVGNWSLTRKDTADTSSLGSTEVSTGAGIIPDGNPLPEFNPSDVLEYRFNPFGEGYRLEVLNYKGSPTTPLSYSMENVGNPTTTSSIYYLRGVGDYDTKYLYLEFDEVPTTVAGSAGKKARVSTGNSINDVTAKHEDKANKWNLFSSEFIKITGAVFEEAAKRHSQTGTVLPDAQPFGAYVELGYAESGNLNIYDPKLTKTYTIIPNEIKDGDTVVYPAKTIIISNRASDTDKLDGVELPRREDIYSYEMLASMEGAAGTDQQRAIALLRGGVGTPDANKYIVIRLPDIDDVASIKTLDEAELVTFTNTSGEWHTANIPTTTEATFRYRTEKSVVSGTEVLDKLKVENQFFVDQDGIYLSHDTTEWSFSDAFDALTASAIKRTSALDGKTVSTLTVYKTIKVKSAQEDANKGILYLKGPRGAAMPGEYHGKYVAVIFDSSDGAKFYKYDTLTEAEDALENIDKAKNLFDQTSVIIDDRLLVEFFNAGGKDGLGTLDLGQDIYTYNKDNTDEIYLDTKQRLVLYVRNSTTKSTNYYRIQPLNVENDNHDHPNFMWKVVDNTRDDLKFAFKGNEFTVIPTASADLDLETPIGTGVGGSASIIEYWAFGFNDVELNGSILGKGETGIVFGIGSTVAVARRNRNNALDPKLIPIPILRNTHRVTKTLHDRNDWFMPVDENRDILDGPTDANKFAFRLSASTISEVYDFKASLRSTFDHTVIAGDSATFLLKIIENTDDYKGVILPYGITEELAGDFDDVLSNQYVALEVGRFADETKVKLAIGESQIVAERNLSALLHWNYVSKSVLDASYRVPESLGLHNTIWVTKEFDDANPVYTEANTTDWSFRTAEKRVEIKQVVAGSVTDSGLYDILMIEDESTTKAIFQLNGVGAFNEKFMAVEISHDTSNPATERTVTYVTANTITDAKTVRDGGTVAGVVRRKLHRERDITVLGQVFTTLYNRSTTSGQPIVEVTRHKKTQADENEAVDYYDSKSVYEYTFTLENAIAQVAITTISNNADPITHRYSMSLVDGGDTSDSEGYFSLIGSSTSHPEHGKMIGFKDVGSTGAFKIQVAGRKYTKLTIPGTGVVPNTLSGQRDAWNTLWALNVDKNTVILPKDLLIELSEEPIGAISTGTSDQIPNGIYDPRNTMTYTFNAEANTLQLITMANGVRSTHNYNLSIIEGVSYNDPNTYPKTGLFYAVAVTSDTGSVLDQKFIDVTLLNANQFIITYETTKGDTKRKTTALENRKTTYKYSYWTHERLSILSDMDKRLIEKLRDLSTTPQSYFTVDGKDINAGTTSQTKTGLAMLADSRFFKTGNGTSRFNNREGYFAKDDYYVFRFNTLITDRVDSLRIEHFRNGRNEGDLQTRIRMLEYISPNEGTFVILKGTAPNGTEDTTTTIGELKDLFENTVFSIKINSDNQIMLGYGKSSVSLADAARLAKADLVSRATDMRQYTPHIVSEHIAQQEHFVPYILSGDIYRTFVGEDGKEKRATGNYNKGTQFFAAGNQLSLKFLEGGKVTKKSWEDGNDPLPFGGSPDTYFAFIRLKPETSVDWGATGTGGLPGGTWPNEDGSTTGSGGSPGSSGGYDKNGMKLLVQTIHSSGKDPIIFRLHNPAQVRNTSPTVANNAITTTSHWSNVIFNNYHTMALGTGANLLQHKWAYGETKEKATQNLSAIPFYNGSFSWSSSQHRRKEFAGFIGKTYYMANIHGNSYQTIGDFTEPGTRHMSVFPKQVTANGINIYVIDIEYRGDGGTVISKTTSQIFLKDVSNSGTLTFAVGGYGKLSGTFMSFKISGNEGRMIFFKPKSGLDFQRISGFLHDTPGSNIGDYAYEKQANNVRTTGWYPF